MTMAKDKAKDKPIKIYRYYNGKSIDVKTDKELMELCPVKGSYIIETLKKAGLYINGEVLYRLKSISGDTNNPNS
jgi:hypothetical protein